jgi:hypothetical protein
LDEQTRGHADGDAQDVNQGKKLVPHISRVRLGIFRAIGFLQPIFISESQKNSPEIAGVISFCWREFVISGALTKGIR